MRHWEEKDLEFILDEKYFPECIDCGNHYFHKSTCSFVTGRLNVPWETINTRLNERVKQFEEKYGKHGSGIKCSHCSKPAIGEIHVLFHGRTTTIEKWPVCMDHAFHEDSTGRESQFRGFNL